MPFDEGRRAQAEQDRLPGYPHMQRGQVVVGIEGAGHLALRDRMIRAVLHVLFARPQQFDRRARHLLGDGNRLPDIVGLAAPAEAAAEHLLVDVAFVGRQAGRLRRSRRRRLRRSACRTRPRICPRYRARWRSSAPSWRGSGRDSCRPPRPSWRRRRAPPWRRRSRCRHRPAARGRNLRQAISRSTRSRPWRCRLRPRRSAGVERGLGVPPGVGDDGDGVVADLHHLLDALHARDLGFVEALQLAAEHRAVLDRGVEHSRQLDVDAVDHLAGGLVDGVEPLDALADRSSSPSGPSA